MKLLKLYHILDLRKDYLKKIFTNKSYKGIDRIVKIGQALSISLYWDGYDIISNLTKIKDVR